jgi:adenylate cyclase class 2
MSATLEREIKLRFESAEAARAAVLATGATLVHARRLQEDCLLDTPDEHLRHRHAALRVRIEAGRSLLTFKGPAHLAAVVKTREELETVVGDGMLLLRILEELGLRVWFRYQKYREEFALNEVIVAIDETPVGVFVEIEGGDRGIADMAHALGRGPSDYLLDSYRSLFVRDCERRGVATTDMLFDAD